MIAWYCLEQKHTDSIWIWVILTWHDWRHAMANQVHLKKKGKLIHNNNNNGNLSSADPAAQSAEQAYTRNVHRDGKCYKKKRSIYINRCSCIIMQKIHTHTHTHTHTHARAHTHTVQTDGSEGQCGLTEIFWERREMSWVDFWRQKE